MVSIFVYCGAPLNFKEHNGTFPKQYFMIFPLKIKKNGYNGT